MIILGLLGFAVAPIIYYYAREGKLNNPALHWPTLAPILKMEFESKPPRLSGERNGRRVTIDVYQEGVRVATILNTPSKLRIEVGSREAVIKRTGIVVPDAVSTGDSTFEEKFMARCSDKDAGHVIFESSLRQRLLARSDVEILGQGSMVQWILPSVRDPDSVEEVMDILTVLASEMEGFKERA